MKIKWMGYEWITQERWGMTHPEKPKWWYDDKAVNIDDNGHLHLLTHYNPHEFPGVHPKIGAGLVSCRTRFSPGTFEIEAKLPTGKYLWPAFWMYSWDGMAPEIDLLEGYTNSGRGYWDWSIFKPWDVTTNAFYFKDGKHINYGAEKHKWGWKNPRKKFMKYKVEWFPDVIRFFYNGRLVREIKDPYVLAQCNEVKMNVILNNGVDDDCKGIPTSDFVIKSFTYTPK